MSSEPFTAGHGYLSLLIVIVSKGARILQEHSYTLARIQRVLLD